MRTIRFRSAAPAMALMLLASLMIVDAPSAGEAKHRPRLQAAEGGTGAPKRQAAESSTGAPKKQAAESVTGASRPASQAKGAEAKSPADSAERPATADSSAVRPANADSAKGPARPGKAGAERDSTVKKAPEKDEPREEPPVRGPRLPFWPGFSMADPPAAHGMLASR